MTIELFSTPQRDSVIPNEQDLVTMICLLRDREIDPIKIVQRRLARCPKARQFLSYCLI